MDAKLLDLLEQIAKAIAAQFGSNCEVVIHELSGTVLHITCGLKKIF